MTTSRPLAFPATAILATLAISACGGAESLVNVFRSESAHEEYVHTLKTGGLERTALGRDWIDAANRAIAAPLAAPLPFRETGYFAPQVPAAVGYRFDLRRGRKLVISVNFEAASAARLFVDLFRLDRDADSNAAYRVASLAAGDSTLAYDVRRDGTYLLRIQPELLRGGRWTVVQRTEGTLGFPVPGFGVQAIRSKFGVDREAGRRRHQGIDIFARRGTPVVAVVDGYAAPGTNTLGGNVVWLRDGRRGRSFYYAHLDRWALEAGQAVKAGDTVGYIGTTGNARTTPPHLHFGIYEGGPADPLPFLSPEDPAPGPVRAPVEQLGQLVRVTVVDAVMRAGPTGRSDTLALLARGTVGRVTGASGSSLRIALPEGTAGYLDSRAVVPADRDAPRVALEPGSWLRELPDSAAPLAFLVDAAEEAVILGTFGGFELARLDDGRLGWSVARGGRFERPRGGAFGRRR
ncbi:MAG: M23 family metallopeptidase [Gemmatimonadales bacterium]|nr:M23 family metallopeptidase [Gemmatimonadales bacterium]